MFSIDNLLVEKFVEKNPQKHQYISNGIFTNLDATDKQLEKHFSQEFLKKILSQ